MTEIPGKWADLLIKAGFTDRRYGTASMRRLSEAVGVNVSTVSRLMTRGMGLTDENMQKIADALKVPVEELHRLATGVTAKPMTLPMGTEKLTEREKEALAEIIRVLIQAKESGHDERAQKTVEAAEPDQEKTAGRQLSAKDEFELAARRRTVKPHRKPGK